MSAQQGDDIGQFHFGASLEDRIGIAQDLEEAITY
jgi:TPR repeat protein